LNAISGIPKFVLSHKFLVSFHNLHVNVWKLQNASYARILSLPIPDSRMTGKYSLADLQKHFTALNRQVQRYGANGFALFTFLFTCRYSLPEL